MAVRSLILLANAFVVAYSADAALSLLEDLFRSLTGSPALLPLRNGLACLVVDAAPFALLGSALSPRLSPSVLAPLALSALWFATGAAPLSLALASRELDFALLGLQLALAVFAWLRIRALSGRHRWLLGGEQPQRPDFSLAHSLRGAGAIVVIVIAAVFVYLPIWLLSWLQLSTDGFVRFDLAGVSLADRRYAKGDQEVRLVGMMHIGEGESYADLIGTFAGPSTVVLAEGVTDREGRLSVPLAYGRVAQALGLESQDAIESYLETMDPPSEAEWADIRHADLDFADFHPDTVDWLESVAEVWGGPDPLRGFLRVSRRLSDDPGRGARVAEDVLERRNVHLVEELRSALADYDRVIVPWGALHLPYVQQQILAMGFTPGERTQHPLIAWSTVGAALWRALENASVR
jgi:hypothetical protein